MAMPFRGFPRIGKAPSAHAFFAVVVTGYQSAALVPHDELGRLTLFETISEEKADQDGRITPQTEHFSPTRGRAGG